MKGFVIYLILTLVLMLPGNVLAHRLTFSKVGEWGTGTYEKVFVNSHYAYCSAGYAGLDIIDIANPARPKKIANYDSPGYMYDAVIKGNYAYIADGKSGLRIVDISNPTSPESVGSWAAQDTCSDVFVYGNYAYIADGNSGLQIIDVSVPASPIGVGNFATPYSTRGVFVAGNYAYVIMGKWDSEIDEIFGGLIILDISNPYSPKQLGTLNLSCAAGIYVAGNYAYIAITLGDITSGGLAIIDVTDPYSPVQVKFLQESNSGFEDITIKGEYAYCAGKLGKDLVIFDIGSPTTPTRLGDLETPGNGNGVHVSGNYAYVADGRSGLQVVNISDPTYPYITGNYDHSGDMGHLCLSGNYAYTGSNGDGELNIIDVSLPSSLTRAATYDNPVNHMRGLLVKGKYAYVGYSDRKFQVINVTTPTAPVLSGTYQHSRSWYPAAIDVANNYAYVADFQGGLTIIDISNPANPSLVKSQAISRGPTDIYVEGNYAYMTVLLAGVKIIDISNAASPTIVGSLALLHNLEAIYVSGNYAYVASADYTDTGGVGVRTGRLYIINVSNPKTATLVGNIALPDAASDVYVSGNYAYVSCGLSGLKVIDIANPAAPVLAATYDTSGPAWKVHVTGNYIYVANGESGKLLVLQSEISENPPQIHLNRATLNFAATEGGSNTPNTPISNPQTFFITNTGEQSLEWSAVSDSQWLQCTPISGIDNGEVTVSVNAAGLSAGTYTGKITVSDPGAANSPQEITVSLKVYAGGQTSVPFGQFETPIDGTTVSGSIPVTGWVLDDIGIQGVQIYRGQPGALVYIGDAVFVEGARPDVEQTFPDYPMNYKAGWGYMLLTNFLPGANGNFTLYAIATDVEGKQVTLGTKTITVDNAHAVKPFGSIDTPAQGGVINGSSYVNYGWVLTPQPNTVPSSGSTIQVWVDGIALGNPVYNQYREDIATLFPGYNNSGGAVGYYTIDTGRYETGVHTLYWTAVDDAGNSEGIGSRYFSIQNTGADKARGWGQESKIQDPAWVSYSDWCGPVNIGKGYDRDIEPRPVYPDKNGTLRVEIKELERVIIYLAVGKTVKLEREGGSYTGYLAVGDRLKPLPVGSTMDTDGGIFYWQPGPGFVGRYRFVFMKKDSQGQVMRKKIIIDISPKFSQLRK